MSGTMKSQLGSKCHKLLPSSHFPVYENEAQTGSVEPAWVSLPGSLGRQKWIGAVIESDPELSSARA